ncbi:MAG: hypothetical protein PHI23_02415 [Candidatus Peribacteraceae bacterium]|nr:hypothetical protein [Candidatus Peribacteraceae bacterium]
MKLTTHFLLAPTSPLPSAGEILRRVALPFALFCVVLLSFLLLSWFLLFPRIARVDLHGSLVGAGDLRAREQELAAKVALLEEQREEYLSPLDDTAFGRLKVLKAEQPSFLEVRASVLEAAQGAVPEQEDAVAIGSIRYLEGGRRLSITGDVRNVGFQSMTILAQFVETLGHLPGVVSVDPPAFTRESDPVIGPYSPFSLTLTLR